MPLLAEHIEAPSQDVPELQILRLERQVTVLERATRSLSAPPAQTS